MTKKKSNFPKGRELTEQEVQQLRDKAKAYALKTGNYLTKTESKL